MSIEESVDPTRIAIRNILLNVARDIHVEDNIEIEDITAEMLVVSSILSSDDFDGFDEDNDDDFDDDYMKIKEFNELEISQTIKGLSDQVYKLERLDRFEEVISIKNDILNKLPEHAMKWMSSIGDADEYNIHNDCYYLAGQIMRGCVIQQDTEKLNHVLKIAIELNEILGDDVLDIEIFKHNFEKFNNDFKIYETIYNFLKENDNFLQKKLFKELSIDGRKASYMLDWASKLNIINRTRYKDTWILKVK